METFLAFLSYAYANGIVGTTLIYTNIILGIAIFAYEVNYYRRVRKVCSWCWVKLAYAAVGLGWAIAYVLLATVPREYVALFGVVIIRPGITITLTVLAAGAYIRRKHHIRTS